MSETVEAVVIQAVAEIPLLVGLYRAGTVTLYEDHSMSVKWEDRDYGAEFFNAVFNDAQVALAVRSMQ